MIKTLSRNDVMNALVNRPSVVPHVDNTFVYYLWYSEDCNAFLDGGDDCVCFAASISADYYGEVPEDATMDYFYSHEDESDKKFMDIVDYLYNQYLEFVKEA